MRILLDALIWAIFITVLGMAVVGIHDAYGQASYDTVKLTWDRPTEREDGSPIEDAEAGHEILFFQVRAVSQPTDGSDAHIIEQEVAGDQLALDIQVLADECYEFTVATAASPGPACQPAVGYQMSHPSNAVTNCSYRPNPPRDFDG
jgi:hypothetical protein